MVGNEWREVESVKAVMAQAKVNFDIGCWWQVDRSISWWLDDAKVQSPIEAAFVIGFATLNVIDRVSRRVFTEMADLSLDGQVPVVSGGRNYRLDLSVVPRDPLLRMALDARGLGLRIAVELDGHEFHERTREQVEARNERDRSLQADGWRVFHFSGSEVNREAFDCADCVMQAAAKQYGLARAALARELGVAWDLPEA